MRRWAIAVGSVGLIGALLAGSAVAGRPSKRPSDDDRGRELYDRHCLACHGAAFAGDGPAAAAMVRPVPDLKAKVSEVDAWVDASVDAVLVGKGAMPGFEATFDKADARRVARWSALLATGAAPQPPGADPAAEPDPKPEAEDER